MPFVRPDIADHQEVGFPIGVSVKNLHVRSGGLQVFDLVERGDDERAIGPCSSSQQLSHVVVGRCQVKGMPGSGDRIQLRATLDAELLKLSIDAFEEFCGSYVVILNDGVTLAILQNSAAQLPADRV